MEELYKKYRPRVLKHVIGQPEAVAQLEGFIKRKNVPHAIALIGPSGVGKTTIARALQSKLECGNSDFCEINAAETRGIDTIRDIKSRMHLAPMSGKARIYLLDESHKLTNDAQVSLLKMLEDTPRHVYFMLATTDPQKLIPTIRTRCTEIKLRLLSSPEMEEVVSRVLEGEEKKLSADVIERLIEVSEGSARKVLVLLHQIIDLESEEQQLESLLSSDVKRKSIEIATTLLNPRSTWMEMCAILKSVEEEPESLRWMVLGYMSGVMLNNGKMTSRASIVIEYFRDHWFDCKKAGLVNSCFQAMNALKEAR